MLQRIRDKAVAALFWAMFRVDERRPDLVRLGTPYGGWWVPTGPLTSDMICYLGGVGTDISFDLGLIERAGCHVWALDPTPKTRSWLDGQRLPEQFHFVPVGLSGQRDELRFYLPKDPEHVSASVKNLQGTSDYFTAPVQTVAQTMSALGHDHVDLVKLDIEGAEHDTIRQMVADAVLPTVLLVEYDQPEPLAWAWRTTALLRENGYKLVKLERYNLTFVRD